LPAQDAQEGAWVKEQKVIVKNGKISEYRVDLKVTSPQILAPDLCIVADSVSVNKSTPVPTANPRQ
jgi:hypothetical protein